MKEAAKWHRKSEGTTWRTTHPYLLHFQPDKNSRCGERLIGLDPTQQWLICSTYMSQMVGFQCSWCRKSTQEYWSFFLSAWSPQELNICTDLEGERWRNPSLAWREPECSSFSKLQEKIGALISPASQPNTRLRGRRRTWPLEVWSCRSSLVDSGCSIALIRSRGDRGLAEDFSLSVNTACTMIWHQTHTCGTGQQEGPPVSRNIPVLTVLSIPNTVKGVSRQPMYLGSHFFLPGCKDTLNVCCLILLYFSWPGILGGPTPKSPPLLLELARYTPVRESDSLVCWWQRRLS